MSSLLSLRDLHIGIRRRRRDEEIVRGVNLDVDAGEKVGIVGESGSGKTLTMLSVLRLLASPPLSVLSGEVLLDGRGSRHASTIADFAKFAAATSPWSTKTR